FLVDAESPLVVTDSGAVLATGCASPSLPSPAVGVQPVDSAKGVWRGLVQLVGEDEGQHLPEVVARRATVATSLVVVGCFAHRGCEVAQDVSAADCFRLVVEYLTVVLDEFRVGAHANDFPAGARRNGPGAGRPRLPPLACWIYNVFGPGLD
ncbi:hypothetical protein, partial [Micromonospora craterilacus]|uniref:hypothetical protein n=1 Tax=Micromonospora craterilacus TaxID=1655439 RepID=UPI001F38397C